jgi:hypothetical protein
MRRMALVNLLCGSLCDLGASVVSVFCAISPQRHRESQRSHRRIVNPTCGDNFFSNLLGGLR